MIVKKSIIEIEETLANLNNHVTQGNIPDFPSYRFMTGQIRGLEHALSIIKQHKKNTGEENV